MNYILGWLLPKNFFSPNGLKVKHWYKVYHLGEHSQDGCHTVVLLGWVSVPWYSSSSLALTFPTPIIWHDSRQGIPTRKYELTGTSAELICNILIMQFVCQETGGKNKERENAKEHFNNVGEGKCAYILSLSKRKTKYFKKSWI